MLQAIERWRSMVQWPAQKPLVRALYSAHRLWAKRYPEWEAAFFDEHFLRTRALPLLREQATITPSALAQAWIAQFHAGLRLEQQLINALTPVAADFLYFVAGELRYFEEEAHRPSALQPLWWWWQGWPQRSGSEIQLPILHTDTAGQNVGVTTSNFGATHFSRFDTGTSALLKRRST